MKSDSETRLFDSDVAHSKNTVARLTHIKAFTYKSQGV